MTELIDLRYQLQFANINIANVDIGKSLLEEGLITKRSWADTKMLLERTCKG